MDQTMYVARVLLPSSLTTLQGSLAVKITSWRVKLMARTYYHCESARQERPKVNPQTLTESQQGRNKTLVNAGSHNEGKERKDTALEGMLDKLVDKVTAEILNTKLDQCKC